MSGTHTHSHSHAHGGASAGSRHRGRLTIALVLIAGFLVVEIVAGFLSGSLALLSDAGHMASDVVVLAAALAATVLAARPDRTGRRTFGNYRLEVFASLLAAVMMLGVAAFVLVEGVGRLIAPGDPDVASGPMILVGAIGLAVNVVVMLLLRAGSSESLTVRGAYLEVLADALGSVGVIVAGVLVAATGLGIIDAIVALAVGAFVAVRAVLLGREVLAVLAQSVPAGLDAEAVRADLGALTGVDAVHDLHLWTLTSGMDVASAHLVAADGAVHQEVLERAQALLRERHGLEHATLQIETADHSACRELRW